MLCKIIAFWLVGVDRLITCTCTEIANYQQLLETFQLNLVLEFTNPATMKKILAARSQILQVKTSDREAFGFTCPGPTIAEAIVCVFKVWFFTFRKFIFNCWKRSFQLSVSCPSFTPFSVSYFFFLRDLVLFPDDYVFVQELKSLFACRMSFFGLLGNVSWHKSKHVVPDVEPRIKLFKNV